MTEQEYTLALAQMSATHDADIHKLSADLAGVRAELLQRTKEASDWSLRAVAAETSLAAIQGTPEYKSWADRQAKIAGLKKQLEALETNG